MKEIRVIAIAAIIALGMTGCSGKTDDYPRVPFSGAVTLDGKPLVSGYIIFEPKSQILTQSGGMIQHGKFEVPREDGAIPGTYSVGIFSGAETPTNLDVATPEGEKAARKIRGELVPRHYNIDTTLTAEIKAEGPNTFQFDLSTKPK
ncbi:hypothetical protein V5E97_20290 [Singulisphaera sp. Ch08]|uniref:Carboxypeptidase regulatory-like domain-containing protein n=1 Tax=Singulisphaera sp. Ch08 TaxID=3120278 RepID=A0AAU7C615_9BACT